MALTLLQLLQAASVLWRLPAEAPLGPHTGPREAGPTNICPPSPPSPLQAKAMHITSTGVRGRPAGDPVDAVSPPSTACTFTSAVVSPPCLAGVVATLGACTRAACSACFTTAGVSVAKTRTRCFHSRREHENNHEERKGRQQTSASKFQAHGSAELVQLLCYFLFCIPP